jgi:hypothetical protein
MWTFDGYHPTFDAVNYTWDGHITYTFMGTNSSLILLGVGS